MRDDGLYKGGNMYRAVKIQNMVYAVEINKINDDLENIDVFIDDGDVVLLSEDLESIADIFEIEVSDIEII